MIGTKHISDLITDRNALLQGRINIIDAGVSAGKTRFALTKLPEWAGSSERCLYLIDTTNGEMSIQRNTLTEAIGREPYAFYDYNTKHVWGEDESIGRLPVMTYAGFGSEVRKVNSGFRWFDYDYIICDEMQNLVDYQRFNERSTNLEAAEDALRAICAEGTTTIVAMSATPQKIRERFGTLCHEVSFDRTDLVSLCTDSIVPYKERVKDLLLKLKGKTGILFTTNVEDMIDFIDFANSKGIRANGFWSVSEATQKRHPHTPDQRDLREKVLTKETIPENVDVLVINRASETCIKIKEEHRKVDFMIVNNCNPEIQTQVRGRYHGDLPEFYYHDIEAANLYQIAKCHIPTYYFGKRLYSEDWNTLIRVLNLCKPDGTPYGKQTLFKLLVKCGYTITEPKKDSKNGGKYYRILLQKGTNLE